MSFTVRSTAWNTTEYSWKWIYLQHESFITSFALFLLEDFCHPGFWDNPLFLQLFCLLWWVLLPRSLMWVSPTFLLFTVTLSLHSPWLNSSVPTASTYLHSGNSQNYISGPNLSLESGSLWPDLAPQLNTRQAGSLQPRVSQRVTCEASPSLPSVLPGNAPLQVLSRFLIHGCNHVPSLLPPGWSFWNISWILSLSLPKWLWVAYREHTGLRALGKHVPSLRLCYDCTVRHTVPHQWSMHLHSSCLPICPMPGQPSFSLHCLAQNHLLGEQPKSATPLPWVSLCPCHPPDASQWDVFVTLAESQNKLLNALPWHHAPLIPAAQAQPDSWPTADAALFVAKCLLFLCFSSVYDGQNWDQKSNS